MKNNYLFYGENNVGKNISKISVHTILFLLLFLMIPNNINDVYRSHF